MERQYGNVIRISFQQDLKSLNWIEALEKQSNPSDVKAELKTRVPTTFDALILLAKKAPRDLLFEILSPAKIIEFLEALLGNPEVEEVRQQLFKMQQRESELHGKQPDPDTPSLMAVLDKIDKDSKDKKYNALYEPVRVLQNQVDREKDPKNKEELQNKLKELQVRVAGDLHDYLERMKMAKLSARDKKRYDQWQDAKKQAIDLDRKQGELMARLDRNRLQLAREAALMSIEYCKQEMQKLVPQKYINRYDMMKPLDDAFITISDLKEDEAGQGPQK